MLMKENRISRHKFSDDDGIEMCLGHLTDRAALLPSTFFQVVNSIILMNLVNLIMPMQKMKNEDKGNMIIRVMMEYITNSKPEETRADIEADVPESFYNPLNGSYLHQ